MCGRRAADGDADRRVGGQGREHVVAVVTSGGVPAAVRHGGLLQHLDIASEMTQADLARAVLVRPQSIAPLLHGLERRGLLRRKGDRARGRRNPVQITDDGRRALAAVWGIVLASNDLADAGLTARESAELNRLLLKVVHGTRDAISDDDSGWRWQESRAK